ncbi:MAG: ThuA domain-containing protein [Pirellulales bacterium]|nr:ThuA domain-containing protein [Pirellulales bacterium]
MRKLVNFMLVAAMIPWAAIASAQNEDPWQKKKAERFKPLTAQQRQAITAAVPKAATVTPKQPRRILMFYRCEGFIHTSIPHANFAMEQAGKHTQAFDVDLADTYDVFTKENLAKYDCILLNNTTHMKFPTSQHEAAFLDFIASGKGLAGFHAASDNFYKHPKCCALVGGQFNGHPWNAGGKWAFKLDDPEHPLNQAFGGRGFWHTDEIYQYRKDSYQGPEVLRLLISLDMSKEEVSGRIDDGPREVPVSWVRQAGQGRVFYTNFGHREDTFWNPVILQHMCDGIQYALGDLKVDDLPTAKSEVKTAALAPAKP